MNTLFETNLFWHPSEGNLWFSITSVPIIAQLLQVLQHWYFQKASHPSLTLLCLQLGQELCVQGGMATKPIQIMQINVSSPAVLKTCGTNVFQDGKKSFFLFVLLLEQEGKNTSVGSLEQNRIEYWLFNKQDIGISWLHCIDKSSLTCNYKVIQKMLAEN